MTKITQKKLIESLRQMKEIKPRKEWAVLLKSQILSEQQEITPIQAQSAGFESFFSNFFEKKMGYAFSAVLLLAIGIFGLSRYAMPGDTLFSVKKIADQSQASLTGQTQLNQDVATLNSRINDLAQITKEGNTANIPPAVSEVSVNVSQLVKNLKNNPKQTPQTIKEIASSLKTLADVPGTDLSNNQDVKDLYQAVVQNQIDDLQKTTLTDDQKKILTTVEDLAKQGKYSEALEKILLINQ